MGPPKRPVKPVKPPTASPPPVATPVETPAPVVAAAPAAAPPEPTSVESETLPPEPARQQPISPPSEPMQYRAIGLLRGRYVPTEEVFNRGQIMAQDGTAIDAVLLGRVTSLVKKYLDMEADHLWVVYPRTNPEANNALNVQIVGVWEPETLMGNKDEDSETASASSAGSAAEAAEAVASAETAQAEPIDAEPVDYVPADEIDADVFSIRGEIARYHEDKGEILIGIQQKVKSGNRQQRTFKLLINGKIEEKTIGYFWDFDVRREGLDLVVHGGSCIAAVPPKKKKKRFGGGGGGGGKKRFTKGGPSKPYGRRDRGSGEGSDAPKPREGSDVPKPRPVTAAANATPAETPAPAKVVSETSTPEPSIE
ncbi:MAG: hypothetical protein AAFU71_01085 [Cyanobacteria bacterium J06632_22]